MKLAPQSGVQVTLLLDEQPEPHAKSHRKALGWYPEGQLEPQRDDAVHVHSEHVAGSEQLALHVRA